MRTRKRRRRPAHCGQPAFDVTLPEDLAAGVRRWVCSRCGRELGPEQVRAPGAGAAQARVEGARGRRARRVLPVCGPHGPRVQ